MDATITAAPIDSLTCCFDTFRALPCVVREPGQIVPDQPAARTWASSSLRISSIIVR